LWLSAAELLFRPEQILFVLCIRQENDANAVPSDPIDRLLYFGVFTRFFDLSWISSRRLASPVFWHHVKNLPIAAKNLTIVPFLQVRLQTQDNFISVKGGFVKVIRSELLFYIVRIALPTLGAVA
jgi:hypothetical protein